MHGKRPRVYPDECDLLRHLEWLHYFEHWHTIEILLSDYDLIKAVGGFEHDFEKNVFDNYQGGDDWRERTPQGFESTTSCDFQRSSAPQNEPAMRSLDWDRSSAMKLLPPMYVTLTGQLRIEMTKITRNPSVM